MASDDKWYFSKEQLANTPSHKYGFDADKELSCRQQAANFIQDMGQRLQVTQLCINTAIVYMHRYYVFHSFSHFHRNDMAIASLFLAAKVEEQPRKLEHVIKVAQVCLHKEHPLDTRSEQYQVKSQDLIVNENLLLQTLGFDVAIDHPHTHVVKCCHLVRATKELAQTSYFMASNSLHLTTMCLQYKPTVVACFCIHLACKWTNWEIPPSMEGKLWFWYVDRSVTQELLEYLTDEFLCIFDKCSSRLKRKITALSDSQNMALLSGYSYPGMDNAARKQDEQPSNVPSFHAQPVTIVQNLAIQARGPDGVIKHPSASRIEENKKRITETLVLPFTYKPLPTNTQPQSSSYHNNGSHSAILEANINSASSLSSSSQILNSPPMVHDSFKHNSSNVQPEYTLPHSNRNTHNSGSHSIIQHESVPSFQQSHYKGNHNLSLNGASHLHKNSASGRPTETKIFTPNHHQKTQIKVHNISKSSASGVNSRSARGCHQISNRNSTSGGKSIENNLIKSPACEESLHKIKSPAPLPKPPSTHFTIPQPKPASIFSPEKVTPSLYSPPRDKQTLSVVLNSPVASGKIGHNRTSSSSSEAELIPVMQKLENISGFGSIAKGKTAVKLSDRVPDLIQSIRNVEVKPTTENSVSAVPKASNVKSFSLPQIEGVLSSNQDYRNFKGHKKKTKHKEHKDQDKEKDKKQKQKDKHYEKHRDPKDPAPIKITIPKDKINHIFPLKPEPSLPLQNSGDVLKIKIPKEKLLQTPPTGLKIKISNDLKVNNGIKHTITSVATPPPPSPAMTRKRDHTLDRQELQRPPTKSPRGQMKPNAHYRMGSEVNYSRPHMSWYRPRFHQRFPPRMHHLPHFQLHQPMLMFTQHPPPYLIPVYSHYPNPNYIPAHYTHHPPPPPLPIGPPPVTPPPPPLPPPE